MTVRDTPWPQGTPSWVDLTTSDPAAGREFYEQLFGWQLDVGDESTGHYAMASLDGHAVCGINGMPAESGHPPFWATYLATDDADATAQAAEAAGGKVFMAPMDVMDLGRMALLEAPGGGFFGIWQTGTHGGFGVANAPNAVTWDEFMSRDFAGAKDFYAKVFGYTYTDIAPEGMDYATIEVEGNTVGGMGTLPPQVPAHVPPHWRVYFAVDDADAAVEKVTELGGSVLRPAMDMPYGRHADVADPQGTMFSLIKPAGPPPE
jgi:predicted enzyme related to lactoylglutathione lyase